MPKLLDQRFARERGTPLVEFAQLRPGKDDAVPIDE
jgi:hypothetical protein